MVEAGEINVAELSVDCNLSHKNHHGASKWWGKTVIFLTGKGAGISTHVPPQK
jgi:hypothetical protein